MKPVYKILPELFLRAPYYSYIEYDLDRLPEILSDAAFQNSILLASPAFYKVLKGRNFEFTKLREKEKLTLAKYYNRMCFRPTPFGSFSSVSLLEWGNGENVKFDSGESPLLHLLPDQTVWDVAYGRPQTKTLTLNPALYHFGKQIRFVKTIAGNNNRYQYQLEALEASSFNLAMIRLFKKKSTTQIDLIKWIRKKSGVGQQEAVDFIDFLIDEQIIFTPGTGHVIGNLADGDSQERLSCIPVSMPFDQKLNLEPLISSLEQQFPAVGSKQRGNYLYSALERKVITGGPAPKFAEEILRAVSAIHKLSNFSEPSSLTNFIVAFSNRFDLEKVPLLHALDPDYGISYRRPASSASEPGILEAIRFPEKLQESTEIKWTPVQQLLFSLWQKSTQVDKRCALVITQTDINGLNMAESQSPSPNTLAVMFRMNDEQVFIEQAGGVTATALTGRFSAFGQEFASFSRKIAQIEEAANPEVIFADIGQLSGSHVDNINRRAQLYSYEIPVNVSSVLPYEKQIALTDLFIHMEKGKLILEDVRRGKRVIPRLATAFNYPLNELGIFNFLGDLQFQGTDNPTGFDLEKQFPGLKFYPKVQFEETVISLAKWSMRKEDLPHFENPDNDLITKIKKFRSAYGLPAKITLANYDQQLVFNLADKGEVFFFLDCLRGLEKVTLIEYFEPGKCIKMKHQPMAGQFITILTHQQEIYRNISSTARFSPASVQRDFLPGEDWLYLKIFVNTQSADQLLLRVISPFLKKHSGSIANWFFIRYAENGNHLRFRVKITNGNSLQMLSELSALLRYSGQHLLVRDMTTDIYRRELERYGPEIIEQVEYQFCMGSQLVINFLSSRSKKGTVLTDFSLALISAYHLISCFFTNDECIEFTGEIITNFQIEFLADKQLKFDMDLKYRELKHSFPGLIEKPFTIKGCIRSFSGMVQNAKMLVAKCRSIEHKKLLLADLVHMQMNRTFNESQRKQEFLVYFCLGEYLVSGRARKRKANSAFSDTNTPAK